MKNISVTVFINILFTLVLSLIITALFTFISWDKERQRADELTRYRLISNALLSTAQLNPTKEKLEQFYQRSYIKPVSANANKMLIMSKGKVIFEEESIYGFMKIYAIGDNRYIYLERYGTTMMLEDIKSKTTRLKITILVAVLIASLFLFLYIAIMKKISPLKKLNRQILSFAKGNMDVKITHKSKDEIGQIGESFDDAIHYIKTLLESKNLFMRNMMHELKTPITKGRIAVEMIDDGSSKKTLIHAFERMNELINELAHVERITTQGLQPKLQKVSTQELMRETQALLLVPPSRFTVEYHTEELITDSKLLALALKNLIDNGLKYSEGDEPVKIILASNAIRVISKGKSLEHPLDYYLEPFTQEEKRQSGFGLGLYIVNNIACRLNYKLHYYYKDGRNVFELQLNPPKESV